MNEEKKPWWKKVLIAIGSFFAALLTFILFGTINRRSNGGTINERTEQVGNDIDQSVANNTEARGQVEDIKRTVDELGNDIDNQRQATEECLDIIQRAKQNATKK